MSENKNLIIKECSTARELWELISPENDLFKEFRKEGDAQATPIFRGQSDSEWGLEPSLLREPNKPKGLGNEPPDSSLSMFHELRLLQEFVESCDQLGIALPGDSSEFRSKHLAPNAGALDQYIKSPGNWPNNALLPLMAIAQHYGVPTRLLDWSKRSYVAALFAAVDALRYAVKHPSSNRKLAIWVLDARELNLVSKVDVVGVPSGINANIGPQRGCFTMVRQTALRGEPFDGPVCLDKLLSSHNHIRPLIKLTLPISEACNLLGFCELYGLTIPSLFPTLSGAAKEVELQSLKWRWFEINRDSK